MIRITSSRFMNAIFLLLIILLVVLKSNIINGQSTFTSSSSMVKVNNLRKFLPQKKNQQQKNYNYQKSINRQPFIPLVSISNNDNNDNNLFINSNLNSDELQMNQYYQQQQDQKQQSKQQFLESVFSGIQDEKSLPTKAETVFKPLTLKEKEELLAKELEEDKKLLKLLSDKEVEIRFQLMDFFEYEQMIGIFKRQPISLYTIEAFFYDGVNDELVNANSFLELTNEKKGSNIKSTFSLLEALTEEEVQQRDLPMEIAGLPDITEDEIPVLEAMKFRNNAVAAIESTSSSTVAKCREKYGINKFVNTGNYESVRKEYQIKGYTIGIDEVDYLSFGPIYDVVLKVPIGHIKNARTAVEEWFQKYNIEAFFQPVTRHDIAASNGLYATQNFEDIYSRQQPKETDEIDQMDVKKRQDQYNYNSESRRDASVRGRDGYILETEFKAPREQRKQRVRTKEWDYPEEEENLLQVL